MKYQALIGGLLALFAAIGSFVNMRNKKKWEAQK